MTIEYFVRFIIDLANDELYEHLDGNAEYYFLNGGCYELAKILKKYIENSKIVINKSFDHCGILYNGKIYDASGIVEEISDFAIASDEDIKYMEDRFGLPEKENIDGVKISDFIIEEIKKCNILQHLELDDENER